MQLIGDIFILLLLQPLLNGLVLLYALLFQNMAAAIIVLTAVVSTVFFPLTLKQVRSSARMQALQPRMGELRARYKDNPQALNREMMRMYREEGVSPLGCLGPMLLQFPIWIGLYSAIIKGLGNLPGSFVYLSQRLYSWLPVGAEQLPLNTEFLWMDLAQPDPTPVLPLLVALSTWAQQRMMQPPTMGAQQQQQQRMMMFMMPIMLGFFALTFPAGLALYWFVSNAIRVGMQGLVSGWAPLRLRPAHAPAPAPSPAIEARTADEPESGSDRKDGRGGNRGRPSGARNRPRRRRRRRS